MIKTINDLKRDVDQMRSRYQFALKKAQAANEIVDRMARDAERLTMEANARLKVLIEAEAALARGTQPL
jgi:hypothetical protein